MSWCGFPSARPVSGCWFPSPGLFSGADPRARSRGLAPETAKAPLRKRARPAFLRKKGACAPWRLRNRRRDGHALAVRPALTTRCLHRLRKRGRMADVENRSDDEEWLSVAEVARRSGVTEQAVRLQLAEGKLAGRRTARGGRQVWMVAPAAAARYVDRHATDPTPAPSPSAPDPVTALLRDDLDADAEPFLGAPRLFEEAGLASAHRRLVEADDADETAPQLVAALRQMLGVQRHLLGAAWAPDAAGGARRQALAGAYRQVIDACDALLDAYGGT